MADHHSDKALLHQGAGQHNLLWCNREWCRGMDIITFESKIRDETQKIIGSSHTEEEIDLLLQKSIYEYITWLLNWQIDCSEQNIDSQIQQVIQELISQNPKEDIKTVKKVLKFSLNGKRGFLYCHYRKLQKSGIEEALKIPFQDKKTALLTATKEWEQRIIKDAREKGILEFTQENLHQYTQNILRGMFVTALMRFLHGIDFLNNLPQEELLVIKHNNAIPEEERNFLIDWFSQETLRSRTLKEISSQHTELIVKAFPEIATLYRAVQKIGFTGRIKVKRWQDAALERFNQSPGEFFYIKREYLERKSLYKHLQTDQRARYFFGKILQYIFESNKLPKVNKDDIIKELRKSKDWETFRGYELKKTVNLTS